LSNTFDCSTFVDGWNISAIDCLSGFFAGGAMACKLSHVNVTDGDVELTLRMPDSLSPSTIGV
jgi:hypothetical protein